MNTDAPWPELYEAEARVLEIQTKLHRWATDDPDRRFDDLHNLVADPAFLVVAWDRVRRNRGARSAGVDGVAPRSILFGREAFLTKLRDDLKARRFVPLPVREKLIPAGWQASGTRHPHRPGPYRASSPQAGARADLRGGLQAVQLRLPPQGPRTPSRRSSSTPPTPRSGCWRGTSNRASTRSTTRPSWTECDAGSETSVS